MRVVSSPANSLKNDGSLQEHRAVLAYMKSLAAERRRIVRQPPTTGKRETPPLRWLRWAIYYARRSAAKTDVPIGIEARDLLP